MNPLPTPAWRGCVDYRRGLHEQRVRRAYILAGGAEAFWLLTHPEVVTLGRRSVSQVPSAEWLRGRGADLVVTERGGLATWHGPGQLVGYTLLDIGRRGIGTRLFVCAVEQGLIDWLSTQGLVASRREGLHGVWVADRKIGAIGLHVSRGVTMHGFALNLHPDLTALDGFVPCGISGVRTTSVLQETGRSTAVSRVASDVGQHVLSAIRAASIDSDRDHARRAGVATMSHEGV
jgi:lipoyl(octanoyl) transferase